MYHPLIVILRFLSVHIARFMLCVLYFVYFIISLIFHIVTVCDCHTK